MYRIAVITSDIERDWASRELAEAANRFALGVVVDPLEFEVHADQTPRIQVRGEPAESFDAFIMRGFNRNGDVDYQYEILELLERLGLLVVNSPAGLSVAESKSQTTYCLQEAGLPVPRTLVTQNLQQANDALDIFGTAVVKPLYGSFGVDIEMVNAENRYSLLPEVFEKNGAIYIQEFIPNEGRDIRAFVVGDEVPAAVYRIARSGEWKTNVAQGSSCEPCELSSELTELCLEATRTIGLDYTGVDVMEGPNGPVILELNGAPCWQGLLDGTGHNVASDIVKCVVQMLDSGQPARRPSGF